MNVVKVATAGRFMVGVVASVFRRPPRSRLSCTDGVIADVLQQDQERTSDAGAGSHGRRPGTLSLDELSGQRAGANRFPAQPASAVFVVGSNDQDRQAAYRPLFRAQLDREAIDETSETLRSDSN